MLSPEVDHITLKNLRLATIVVPEKLIGMFTSTFTTYVLFTLTLDDFFDRIFKSCGRKRATWICWEAYTFLGCECFCGHCLVRYYALSNRHLQSTQHDCNDPDSCVNGCNIISKIDSATNPPVLVPPIKSKTSQGRGVDSKPASSLIFSKIDSRIRSAESPRTPPPSR